MDSDERNFVARNSNSNPTFFSVDYWFDIFARLQVSWKTEFKKAQCVAISNPYFASNNYLNCWQLIIYLNFQRISFVKELIMQRHNTYKIRIILIIINVTIPDQWYFFSQEKRIENYIDGDYQWSGIDTVITRKIWILYVVCHALLSLLQEDIMLNINNTKT